MTQDRPAAETWRRAIDGDRDAFEDALSTHIATLHDAAERQLAVERDVISGEPTDQQPVDITPDELVGEAMLQAWDRREQFDGSRMGFRAWLLGLQTRALAKYARRESRYAERKAISLDEEIPTNESQDAVGEQFYEFRQPFDVDTYEQVVAQSTPEDPEIDGYAEADLSDDERAMISDATFQAEARQAVVLHDEYEVSLSDVAQILDASLKETAASLDLARAGMLARMGSADDDHDDDPAVDSYTGDPLPDA